jgi:diguanylate cyclase (GGDEF)-like protein/PAS domain S-box-containing protein
VSADGEIDFQHLAENSVDIICRARLDMTFQYVSPSCFKILGWTPEEMMQAPPGSLMLPEDAPVVDAAIERGLASGSTYSTVTLRMLKKDGSSVWMEVNSREVFDSANGELQEFVIVMRDISERKLLEEKLSALSLTDGLTGLANRRSFDETLEREWVRTLREASQMSLLLIDVDHFKAFNDRYGHQVGDDSLCAISAAVRGAVRVTDMVARYGGEEIAVILPSAGSAGAVETAEKVRAAIEALQLTHEGNPECGGWVTASIGAATAMARQGGTMRMPESLLLAADTALYKAKQGGRNRVATALLVAPAENPSFGAGFSQK